MRIHNPPYPGEIIREFCIEPLGLTVTYAAKSLGVPMRNPVDDSGGSALNELYKLRKES